MWKRITKNDVKSLRVGTKLRVNGCETTLLEHHNDSGFDVKEMAYMYDECSRVFISEFWRFIPVDVWCEQSDFGDLV